MNISCPSLKQNEGIIDRVIRVIIGSVALVASFFWLAGMLQTIGYIIGVISLVTGLIGYCGLYSILSISTIKNKKA